MCEESDTVNAVASVVAVVVVNAVRRLDVGGEDADADVVAAALALTKTSTNGT